MNRGRTTSARSRATVRGKRPRKRVLIVGEGRVTEFEYFEGLRRHCAETATEVIKGDGGDALAVVRRAEKHATPRRAWDEVWCVFDGEPKDHLPEAIERAEKLRFHVAISTPCFEVWLRLHHRDSPGSGACSNRIAALDRFVPGYAEGGKHIAPDSARHGRRVRGWTWFEERWAPRIADAVRRAEGLERSSRRSGQAPPTTVHRVVERMRNGWPDNPSPGGGGEATGSRR